MTMPTTPFPWSPEDVEPERFPWVRHLPAREAREFAADLAGATRGAATPEGRANLHHVVAGWRTTAAILADPELTTELTRPLPDEDHGPVPAP